MNLHNTAKFRGKERRKEGRFGLPLNERKSMERKAKTHAAGQQSSICSNACLFVCLFVFTSQIIRAVTTQYYDGDETKTGKFKKSLCAGVRKREQCKINRLILEC